MAIELNDSGNYVSYPIIKHQRIGESCNLAIIRWEQRDRLRKNPTTNAMEKIPNGVDRNNNPKFKQELVIQAIAISGDMVAAIGDQSGVPAPGDRVRVILKSGGFGQWIEARKSHRGGKMNVGDVLTLATTHGQQYDQNGAPKGAKIETQQQVNAVPRGVTLGLYGPLTLSEGTDPKWIAAAEDAYRADELAKTQKNAIPLGDQQAEGEEDW